MATDLEAEAPSRIGITRCNSLERDMGRPWDTDGTRGIFAFVQEVTQSILNQRRLTTLNQFIKQAPLIQSVNGAYSMITTILQESNNPDVPFSIVYRTRELPKESTPPHSHGAFSPRPSISLATQTPPEHDDFLTTGSHAGTGLEQEQSAAKFTIRLIRSHFSAGLRPGKKETRRAPQTAILCSTSFDRNLEIVNYGPVKEKVFSKAKSTRHIPDSLLITPEEYEPLGPSDPVYDDPWAWPVRSVLADGIPRLVTLPKSTHKLARALLLPILENPSSLESRITTVLIVGINPYQILDNQYLDFLALLVANIASLLHFGRSREEERKSTEALFELNKAKISFFQNVSHELRTPLTLMLAPLDDVLNQTSENAPTRQSLELVRRNSRRLLKLVNTLLQFSRIEAGKGHAIFEETDLTKATREISANFESVARGFGIDYIVNCESLDNLSGGIWVDRAMWGGILLNLIGNAFKHTWEGSVTVHQYPAKSKDGRDGVSLEVKDTGVGIAAEHLHTLFGRFNRIENKQSRSHEGTGIGLSLVKELTEVHGGTVSVTSEVDKGTCFHLWIPAGRGHHPSSQVTLGDSVECGPLLRTPKNEAMNNKTDASMFVEEATQWIAHKAFPGSTLTASGTDSTEEEKHDDDDDAAQIDVDFMRDRQDSVEVNTDYEMSTLDVDESELTKLLIDPLESEDVVIPENTLAKIDTQITPRRASSTIQSPKFQAVETRNLSYQEQLTTVADSLMNSMHSDYNYRAHEERDEQSQDQEKGKMSPRTGSRRSFIIIVDDNNDMRSYLRDILGREFRVRCAVDGLDAIRLISERLRQGKRIDLVLSDVAMPNMNGYELLQRLRGDSATMMTPFILLSARAGEEANVEGLDLGADDCLVKPFSARELLARVRSTIRLSDLRHELIREQRHALELKKLIYSISVRIRSGLSLPQILDTASKELFRVIRCTSIRICRFRRVDQETGQHWVRFVSEIVRVGKPRILTHTDCLLPKGLEVLESQVTSGEYDSSTDLRHVSNCQYPFFDSKSFISVALIYNRKIWGYLLASREADMVDWSQSEKLLFEQTGNQISLAIAHASLWELKKSQQVEMEAAHAANEAKSQILANTSHELRTPIGAIAGALSALEDTDHNLTGEQRDMIRIMQISSDVALSVINDLLDTAKLEAGAMNLNIVECPGLIETLEHSVRIFSDKAGRKEIDLVMEISDDLEQLEMVLLQGKVIKTDSDRLQQVIMNLIGNAVKFTASGKVVVNCTVHMGEPHTVNSSIASANSPQRQQEKSSQQVRFVDSPVHDSENTEVIHATFRIDVSDTGIGIDPEFLKNHIFKSFAQHDQSMTRRFGGTGLGLAISKHLVEMNGGILGVTSNVGQGSTFHFTWPFTIVTPSNGNHQVHPALSQPTLAPEISAESRVVVIEPVAESRHLLYRILSQQNIPVSKLYEDFDNVVQDERERPLDLMGPDGSILSKDYRPNAHFFIATRVSSMDAIVETARALGMLFRQRNEERRATCGDDYKEHRLSIILVIFSSPQGRYCAKDVIKRIYAGGLEGTIQCRYIVKPVKIDRIIECLKMQGPHGSPIRKMTLLETPQPGYLHDQSKDPVDEQATPHQPNETGNQVVSAEDSICMISSDYERGNDCNKNTPESASLGPDGKVDSPDVQCPPLKMDEELTPPSSALRRSDSTDGPPSQARLSKAALRRHRLRSSAEGSGTNPTNSIDNTTKTPNDNPAFSSRSARAAAGKRERKGKCVLCVEDNIINLKVVQYQLQKLGYDTQTACDGQVAVDIIKAQVEMLGQSLPPSLFSGDSQEEMRGVNVLEASLDSPSTDENLPTPPLQLGIQSDLMLNPESNVNLSHDPEQSGLLTSFMQAGTTIDQTLTEEPLSCATLTSPFPSPASPLLISPLPSLETMTITTSPGAMSSLDPTAVLSTVVSGPTLSIESTAASAVPTKPVKIDLILMDCAMPVKSGFDAASEIRAMGMYSEFAANIPIIALTASAVPSTKEKCIASGMNAYMSKPTKLADLEAMLDQWIAQ
ncbi:hypothetical protein BGX34_002579 [Mortierella sp. NVP85]|nr:hypothetical protein BGX34_002579 [Mortierella sp. NVP85]